MARTRRLLCSTSCPFDGMGEELHSTVEEVVSYCRVFSLRCEQSHVNHSIFFFFYTLSLGLLLFLSFFFLFAVSSKSFSIHDPYPLRLQYSSSACCSGRRE